MLLFVHRGRMTFGICCVAVHRSRRQPRRPAGNGEDSSRSYESDASCDHQDDPDRRESDAVILPSGRGLRGERPVHDGASNECERTQNHSWKTHEVSRSHYPDQLSGEKEAGSRRPQSPPYAPDRNLVQRPWSPAVVPVIDCVLKDPS